MLYFINNNIQFFPRLNNKERAYDIFLSVDPHDNKDAITEKIIKKSKEMKCLCQIENMRDMRYSVDDKIAKAIKFYKAGELEKAKRYGKDNIVFDTENKRIIVHFDSFYHMVADDNVDYIHFLTERELYNYVYKFIDKDEVQSIRYESPYIHIVKKDDRKENLFFNGRLRR